MANYIYCTSPFVFKVGDALGPHLPTLNPLAGAVQARDIPINESKAITMTISSFADSHSYSVGSELVPRCRSCRFQIHFVNLVDSVRMLLRYAEFVQNSVTFGHSAFVSIFGRKSSRVTCRFLCFLEVEEQSFSRGLSKSLQPLCILQVDGPMTLFKISGLLHLKMFPISKWFLRFLSCFHFCPCSFFFSFLAGAWCAVQSDSFRSVPCWYRPDSQSFTKTILVRCHVKDLCQICEDEVPVLCIECFVWTFLLACRQHMERFVSFVTCSKWFWRTSCGSSPAIERSLLLTSFDDSSG